MTARLQRLSPRVELALSRKVTSWHEGGHASVRLGRSHEFHDLRDYQRGDNVADIDWRATARTGKLLVKRYTAQRQATVILVVASGRDMAAAAGVDAEGSPVGKHDVALDAAGTIASIALSQGDRIGMVWTHDGEPRLTRPRGDLVAAERLLMQAEAACSRDCAPADLGMLLDQAARVAKQHCVMVIISDDIDIDAELEPRLRRLAIRHDVMFLTIADLDPTDPATARARLQALDDARVLPDLLRLDPTIAAAFTAERERRHAQRAAALRRLSVVGLHLGANDDVATRIVETINQSFLGGRRRHGHR